MSSTPPAPAGRLARLLHIAPPHVLLALAMTALVSGIVFAVSEIGAERIERTRERIAKVRHALTQLDIARSGIARVDALHRGYLLTGHERERGAYDVAVGHTQNAVSELGGLSGDDLETRARIEGLRAQVGRRIDETRRSVLLRSEGQFTESIEALKTGRDSVAADNVERAMDELDVLLENEIRRRQVTLDEDLLQQRISVGVVVLLNLAFLAMLAALMLRQFRLREEHRAALQSEADRLEAAVSQRTSELSALSTHLQASSEREKAQLARDLHDELGGILTSAKIDIAWLEGHSKAADPDVVPRLRRLAGVVDEAVDLKRRVVESLRPSLLDHLGLGPALTWYVNEACTKAGLACRLKMLEDGVSVPPDTAIAMYRLVQEGLVNVVKHARARQVDIEVERLPDGFRLVLADDGIGISGFKPDSLSHGLAGMRHRARALGGRFDLTTSPGGGTRIEAHFPLAALAEAASAPVPGRISSG